MIPRARSEVSALLALDLRGQLEWLLERSVVREVDLLRGVHEAPTLRERRRLWRLVEEERRARASLAGTINEDQL